MPSHRRLAASLRHTRTTCPTPTGSPRRGNHRLAPLLLAMALAGGLGAPSQAQAQTWTGSSAFSSNWSNIFNWSGFRAPFSGATTAIVFDGNRRLDALQDISSMFDLNALTFASGAGAFSLSGGGLRFAGTASTFTQNSTSEVSLANGVQISNLLTYNGNGSAIWNGALANGAGGAGDAARLVKNGTGQLALTAAGSFTGRVELNQGRLLLKNGQALQSAQLVLNTGATLDLASQASAQLRVLSGSGALNLGNTELTLGGSALDADTYSGNLSGTGGRLLISAASGTAARLSGRSSIDKVTVRENLLLLTGGSLRLNNSDEGLVVGQGLGSPSAQMFITGGASVSALGWTTQVDGAGVTQLFVGDAGSQLSTGFQTLVGNHANGLLTVGGGAEVKAGTFLAMGFNNASNGTMRVMTGSKVSNTVGLLGTLTGSLGQASVSGAGALWHNDQLGLGGFTTSQRGGTGTLEVKDGGVVAVTEAIDFWTDSSSITIDGGQLRAGRLASDGAVGSVVLTRNSALGDALVLNGTSGAASFAGVISGTGNLLKANGGTQILAGLNTFSGRTTITGGQIVLAHAGALFNSTVNLQVDNGLSLGSVSEATIGNLSGSGALDIGSATLRYGNNNSNDGYSGVVQGAGGRLVKVGTGTHVLTATGHSMALLAADQGVLMLDGASVRLDNASAPPSGSVLSVGGGELQLLRGAQVKADNTGASSTFVDSNAGGGRLLIDGAGSRLDAGYQVVAGNVFRGDIVVRNSGALGVSFALAMGIGDGSSGSLRVESGGTVNTSAMALGLHAGSTGEAFVTGASSRLTVANTLGLGGFDGGNFGGTGRLSLADGATARAQGTQLWTTDSRVDIDGGQLSTQWLSSRGAVGHIELSADPLGGSALVIDGNANTGTTYSGSIGGIGSLRKTGISAQLLAGSNTFTGAVQVAGGRLRMNTSAAGEYEVLNGARLELGTRNLGNAVVQAQAGGSVLYFGSTVTGGLLVGPGSHDISAVRRLVGTTVSNGVQLTPGSSVSFVGVSNAGRVINQAGSTLAWTGGANTTGSLSVRGTVNTSGFSSGGLIEVLDGGTLANTGGDLVLGGGSRTLVGSVAAPGGSLLLDSSGVLQLNGGLLVNNGVIDGTVNVNFGGLAKGAGRYGMVMVGDGGRFSPGNSPGTVQSGPVTWGAGGLYEVELSSAAGTAGTDWDLWRVNGSLDVTATNTPNGRFTVSLSSLGSGGGAGPLAGFDAHRSWHWLVLDTTDGIVLGNPEQLTLDTRGFLSDTAGGRFSLQVSNGDLYVNFAPVPEPGSWALMLGGLALLGAGVARRRGSASVQA